MYLICNPIGSMYGILWYINPYLFDVYGKLVGKYTIHGSYGNGKGLDLLGGFSPFEKICSSIWESSPNRDEHKTYLKPPAISDSNKMDSNIPMDNHHLDIHGSYGNGKDLDLVGGFNPFEKICSSIWESSPNRDEHKTYLKPPAISDSNKMDSNIPMDNHHLDIHGSYGNGKDLDLVGGFNPFEKICSSIWESSPNRGEHKTYLKPPAISDSNKMDSNIPMHNHHLDIHGSYGNDKDLDSHFPIVSLFKVSTTDKRISGAEDPKAWLRIWREFWEFCCQVKQNKNTGLVELEIN